MDPSSTQEMSSQALESMVVSSAKAEQQQQEKKPRPADEHSQKCPRCESTNTKFCYYNNYSLSQPRYFCKSCRRYWTKGGTLRNVPVGGGCRKNRRSSSSSSKARVQITQQDHHQSLSASSPLLTNFPYESIHDLSLSFASLHQKPQGENGNLGLDEHDMMCNPNTTLCDVLGNYGAAAAATPHGFLDSLRGGFLDQTPTNGLYNHNSLPYNYGTAMGEMGMPYEGHMGGGVSTSSTSAAVKHEMCGNGRDNEGGDSRVLWGFPWQHGGDSGNLNMVNDVDSSRQISCNLGFGSSWHGLVNSPLM